MDTASSVSTPKHNSAHVRRFTLAQCPLICHPGGVDGNMKLDPGWVLIVLNFDPIQVIGQNMEGGCFFARLW